MTRHRALAGACLALAAACGGSPDASDQAPDFNSSSPQTSLVRLPREGGVARAYALPDLSELDWQSEGRLPPLDSVIGVNGELAVIFVSGEDRANTVTALDLRSGRTRPVASSVRSAAVGSDGLLYAVDTGGAIQAIGRRSPERFRSRLDWPAPRLFAAAGGRLLAVPRDGGELALLTSTDSARLQPLADGPVATTPWGDLLAVAADSAVALYDPLGQRETRTVRFRDGARAAAFSPSGHQLYVAQGDGRIAVVERFSLAIAARIELPARVDHLRPGPFGRWLLAHGIGSDSVWIVDLETDRLAGVVPSSWEPDLPLVAGIGTLVIRRGEDVVALDLTAPGFPERGRIATGAEDLWSAPAWVPESVAPREPPVQVAAPADAAPDDADAPPDAVAEDSTDDAPEDEASERVFLQISSSSNPDWAGELAGKLTAAGLPARVLPPAAEGDAYRVVLGPYPSREEAEEIGRSLGMPFFVIGAGETTPVEP